MRGAKVNEYLCLKIGEMDEMVTGRVEDVIQRCWEKYASGVCYHLPFISPYGLVELVETLIKLNATSTVVKKLDGGHAIIDVQNDTVCIGVGP